MASLPKPKEKGERGKTKEKEPEEAKGKRGDGKTFVCVINRLLSPPLAQSTAAFDYPCKRRPHTQSVYSVYDYYTHSGPVYNRRNFFLGNGSGGFRGVCLSLSLSRPSWKKEVEEASFLFFFSLFSLYKGGERLHIRWKGGGPHYRHMPGYIMQSRGTRTHTHTRQTQPPLFLLFVRR